MTETLSVWLGAEVIYLYGTVNGEHAEFALVSPGEWRATVPRSQDGKYAIHLEAYSAEGLEDTYDYELSYGMIGLITDRTQADVSALFGLVRKGWDKMTQAERDAWLQAERGAYNHTDLNRVSHAIQYIVDLLDTYGYSVSISVRTDWSETDIPTESDMQDYLGGVQAIKDKFYGVTPLPDSMNNLTYIGANNVEKLLLEIELYINRMVAGFRRCGTFLSGQGVILP